MSLEIADMRKSFIDAPGHICISVYLQGCSIQCPGCHNPELHEFKKGRIPEHVALNIIFMASGFVDAVALMGGEPLDADKESLLSFIKHIKGLGMKVCLYTGYSIEDVPQEILDELYMIKYGRYGDPQVYMKRVSKVQVKDDWEVVEIEV